MLCWCFGDLEIHNSGAGGGGGGRRKSCDESRQVDRSFADAHGEARGAAFEAGRVKYRLIAAVGLDSSGSASVHTVPAIERPRG